MRFFELGLESYDEDSEISLKSLNFDYLHPEGKYYSASENFNTSSKPGTNFEYCNVCYALIGYLVERLSNQTFDQYTKVAIFEPLGMNNTFWFFRDIENFHDRVAMQYSPNGVPYGYITHPVYPAGFLKTTVDDLSRFLSMFIQYGYLGNSRILKPFTVTLMREDSVSVLNSTGMNISYGLGWATFREGGKIAIGHNGAFNGISTLMYFFPGSGAGLIILANVDNVDTFKIAGLLS